MKYLILIIACCLSLTGFSQFHGSVGMANTSAIHADSSVFIAWAKTAKVTRGYQDISNTSLGYASVGDSSFVVSKADGGVVSLGDGGSAIITFSAPIANGPGYDFAVFENSFNNTFLELAFVEVSSDGINYVRFPAICNLPVTPQFDNNANMDATKINNLAGKYRSLYGTPFDLQELSAFSQIDINAITHIKVIDVIGSITAPYINYDSQNQIINDPWPTPFNNSGFDLDAIGVIHQNAVGITELSVNKSFTIYPNPAKNTFRLKGLSQGEFANLTFTNVIGEVLISENIIGHDQTLDINQLNFGIYFVTIQTKTGKQTIKLIKE